MSNIRRRIAIEGTGIERKEIPELPMAAIREAIMNGLTHADYRSGEAMQVDIFTDSVEIYNPGWFLDGQTPEAHLLGKTNGLGAATNSLLPLSLSQKTLNRMAPVCLALNASAMRKVSESNT